MLTVTHVEDYSRDLSVTPHQHRLKVNDILVTSLFGWSMNMFVRNGLVNMSLTLRSGHLKNHKESKGCFF